MLAAEANEKNTIASSLCYIVIAPYVIIQVFIFFKK